MNRLTRGNGIWLAALAAAMVLASYLRLVDCERALSNDEAYSWRITQYAPGELVQRTRWDANPPLYYTILQGWEALCGDSPWALRGLSVLLAALTVPLTYATCVAALAGIGRMARPAHGGALFAAFLVAVHPAQVGPGQTARMYPLGVFLAALSSWLLVKALARPREPLLCWTCYGITAAALAYTHYYGLFALVAQGLFAVVYLAGQTCTLGWRETRGLVGWLAFGSILAAGLFAPWLPAFFQQQSDVRDGFWIPPVSFDEAERVFWTWCTGLAFLDSWERATWLVVLLGSLGWTVYSRSWASGFFLMQAAVPWLLSIGWSQWSGRSIFYDRYLTFAQWALLCYWGTLFAGLPDWPWRLLLVIIVGSSAAWESPWRWGDAPPALAHAAAFLKAHYQPGDEVWTDHPAASNRLRYYAAQEGLRDIPVKCSVQFAGVKGHIVHLSSLSGEDILPSAPLERMPARFWQAGPYAAGAAPTGARTVVTATFQDRAESYGIMLCEKTPAGR